MKAIVQFYTKKGAYGRAIILQAPSIKEIWEKLDKAFDKVPDAIGDEKLMNWCKMNVEIER